MWLQRKKTALLTALAAVAVCAVFALTWMITRHFAVCTDCAGVCDTAKAHIRNIFIAAAGVISLAAAGILFYAAANKKKKRMENFIAMDRINEELQFISTERTRIAARLDEQERLFGTVINAVDAGVFWRDSNSVYRGCNENYAALIGLDKPESIIGKTDFDIEVNCQQGDLYAKCDREVMKTGIPLLNMEETRCRADGTVTNLLTSKVPLRDANGEINGVMGICTDITELRKAQNKIRPENARLFDAIDAMQEGFVLIDSSANIIESNAWFADLLEKSADRLRGQNICDCMSRPAGERLRNIIETFRLRASGEPAVIQHRIGQKDLQIKIQPLYRQQQYDGAVGNVVDVSVLTEAKERAELANSRKTKFIADMSRQIRTPLNTIAGFADLLEQEKLTAEQDRFVRMIAASAENILSILAEIISLSEEEVGDSDADEAPAHTAESSDPLADDREGNSEVFKSLPHAPGSLDDTDGEQHAILIVDDVLENRMLLDTILKKAGYNLSFAANGHQAVKLAGSAKFDVILMDIQMAGMDGTEATRRIHTHGLNADTPIIAMTASVTEEDEALCFDAGCDDFIRKPIKKDLLMRKVWRFIQQQEQIKAARRGGEITSFLAADPDYQKTIVTFIENLPARITEMQQALDEENLQELAFKAHALKGLGGFAGFPIYTEMAKSIEKSIKESQLEEIRQELDEMVALCQRTRLPKE
ncbi:MAG: hypothetical protein DRP66_04995 [Planctomycetota bacterium]|nr:MAG: hypothetical protein DRP66_04995 [Planctomycetota bacterium]